MSALISFKKKKKRGYYLYFLFFKIRKPTNLFLFHMLNNICQIHFRHTVESTLSFPPVCAINIRFRWLAK